MGQVPGERLQTRALRLQVMELDVRHGVKGLAFCYLSKVDVVRHPLVQKIIEAYESN